MPNEPPTRPTFRSPHLTAGALGVLELVVLGALSAYLVLSAIPTALEVEWQCVGALGLQRVPGDTYLAGVAAVGTFGWILVALGILYAQIVGRGRLSVALPLVWFVLFVAGALVAAAAIGSQPCPS